MTVAQKGQQKMVGANFVSVGETTLNLQDLKLVGDDGSEGLSFVMWWDPKNKGYSEEAHYVCELYDPDTGLSTGIPGWGDAMNWYPINKTFAPGEGFWFVPYASGTGLTTAGAIADPDEDYIGRTVETKGQQIMVINAYPAPLDIQKLTLIGDDGSEGLSFIMWWDPVNKCYSEEAHFVCELYDPDTGMSTGVPGWGDAMNWYPIQKTIATGEGFWFVPYASGTTICLPNPLKATK